MNTGVKSEVDHNRSLMNGMRVNMNANQVCQKKAFSNSESSPFSECKSPKYHESDVPNNLPGGQASF